MTTTTKSLLWILLLCILLMLQFFHSEKIIKQKEYELSQKLYSIENPYKDMNLFAKSALVIDASSNTTFYTKHHTKTMPLASIAKLMTALVMSDNIENNTEIPITKDSLSIYGEYGLELNEKWNAKELIQFMLVVSSNDAARALRDYYESENKDRTFIEEMNNYAKYAGLSSLSFYSESGLDEKNEESDAKIVSATGSCFDTSKLLYILYKEKEDILKITKDYNVTLTAKDGTIHQIENTDILTQEPNLNILAGKTGMTDLAGGNLVVLADVGIKEPVAICVLGSTKEGRFSDVRELIYRTQSLVKNIKNLNLDSSTIFN